MIEGVTSRCRASGGLEVEMIRRLRGRTDHEGARRGVVQAAAWRSN